MEIKAVILNALLAVLAVLALAAGVQTWRLDRAQAENAAQLAEWNKKVGAAEARSRDIADQYQAKADEATKGLADAKTRIASLMGELAGVRIDSVGLHKRLGAYAAGPATEDSVAACRDRAGRLAEAAAKGQELLATGAGLLRESEAAGLDAEADVAALIKAWPAP